MAKPVTRHLKMSQTRVGRDRFRHVEEWLGRRFALGEHPIVGKKLTREWLESMTLNLRATLLEGEI
jgi:hypothetical protein